MLDPNLKQYKTIFEHFFFTNMLKLLKENYAIISPSDFSVATVQFTLYKGSGYCNYEIYFYLYYLCVECFDFHSRKVSFRIHINFDLSGRKLAKKTEKTEAFPTNQKVSVFVFISDFCPNYIYIYMGKHRMVICRV